MRLSLISFCQPNQKSSGRQIIRKDVLMSVGGRSKVNLTKQGYELIFEPILWQYHLDDGQGEEGSVLLFLTGQHKHQ